MSTVSWNITFQMKQRQFELQNILFIMFADDVCTKERHCIHMKAACTLIKLSSGLVSRLSPSSLLPHSRKQCTTHKCLPFIPASPPTFLTWLRHSVTGIMVLTVWAGYHYYTFLKHKFKLLLFFSKTIVPWIFWVRTKNSQWLMQENNFSKNDASDIIIHCLYGRCAGNRENDDTCGKTMRKRTMDSGFTVHIILAYT
jgi:hypothetical protein